MLGPEAELGNNSTKMADAQLMEEELQQSVMQSEREAELAHDELDEDVEMGDDSAFASQSHIDVGSGSADGEGDDDDMEHEEERRGEYEEEDEHGEHDDDHSGSGGSEEDDDGEAFDEDAEGEDDDEPVTRNHHPRRRSPSMTDGHEDADDDEDEGVGAVKIRPGETDDDDDESSDGSASLASASDADSDGEAEWDAAEIDDADEEEEFENAVGHCLFCKQDEEHDPGEEFEVFLACTKCGDNGQSLERSLSCCTRANTMQLTINARGRTRPCFRTMVSFLSFGVSCSHAKRIRPRGLEMSKMRRRVGFGWCCGTR